MIQLILSMITSVIICCSKVTSIRVLSKILKKKIVVRNTPQQSKNGMEYQKSPCCEAQNAEQEIKIVASQGSK